MTPTAPTVTAAYVTRYDEVIVEVVPFTVEADGRTLLVDRFVGDAGDRGGYLIGRGTVVKKDGTVGVRKILLSTGRTPANVRAAARALFEA